MLIPAPHIARRVGAITLLALGATIAGFVFLLDRAQLGSPIYIHVAFHHVAGLHEHAPFVVAGHPIGRIEALTPILHGTPELDGTGVSATVAIASIDAWKVPAAAEIFVASRGPLSDKYLEVAPPPGDPGPAIHDGQALRGVDPPSLDNVLQHTWDNITIYQQFVAAIGPELASLRAELASLRDQLVALALTTDVPALAADVRDLAATAGQTYHTALGGDAGLAELRATLAEARAVVAQLRAAIDLLAPRLAAVSDEAIRVRDHLAQAAPIERAVKTIATVRAVLDGIDPALANLDALTTQLAAGEGSIGRIMTDPEFPEDTRDLGKLIKRHPWRVMETPPDR